MFPLNKNLKWNLHENKIIGFFYLVLLGFLYSTDWLKDLRLLTIINKVICTTGIKHLFRRKKWMAKGENFLYFSIL